MNLLLLLCAVVLLASILGSKLSGRLGIPTLFFFIALGMLFGTDGLLKIDFENYHLAEQVCSAALIFIMFYGGFGTKWSAARPVARQSVLLSTLGVVITAGLTGLFCRFVLGMGLAEGLLVGAVLGSTDAASVFSVLRSQRLNLKYNTASLLEIESGSNDPCAYMLTVTLLAVLGGTASAGQVAVMLLEQVVWGVAIGVAVSWAAGYVLRRWPLTGGLDGIFLIAASLIAYALPTLLGGNGYLSAYLAGILLGNQDIPRKKNLAAFFDVFNNMMQILIFFLLGLLVFPSRLPAALLPAVGIALFMTLIARPAAVFLLLRPFRAPLNQMLVVSWAGLRGAASIVFAIVATVSPAYGDESIFQIVFCVVLLSILIQGTLLPQVARRAGMIDRHGNVLRTFNDYSEETSVGFIRVDVDAQHPWRGKPIRDITVFPGTLIAAILRQGKAIVPKGDTCLEEGDALIIGAKEYSGQDGIELSEILIDPDSPLVGKTLREADLRKDSLVVLIQREGHDIIPDGESRLCAGDMLVLYSRHGA